MAVLNPLKLIIDNYPEGQEEFVEVATTLKTPPPVPARSLQPRGLHRAGRLPRDSSAQVLPPLSGKEVRLRNAYFITAHSVVKDAAGNIVEVHCTYDPAAAVAIRPTAAK